MRKNRTTSFVVNPAKRQDPNKFTKYLVQGEKVIYASEIVKRRHFSSKRRVLILTNTPRLFYVCEQSKDVKGFINWCNDIRVERRRDKAKGHFFDLITANRVYNMEVDSPKVIDEWVVHIGRVRDGIERIKEERKSLKDRMGAIHEEEYADYSTKTSSLNIVPMPETRDIDMVPLVDFDANEPFGLALIRLPFEGRHQNELTVNTGDLVFFRVLEDGDAIGSHFYPLKDIHCNLGVPGYFSWEILWFESYQGERLPLLKDYESTSEKIPSLNAGTLVHVYYIDIGLSRCFVWINGVVTTLPAQYIVKGKLNLTTLETDNFKTIEPFVSFTQTVFQT